MTSCTSLRDHNPRFADLVEAIEVGDRRHEMLARRLHINVEQHAMLYTPAEDLSRFGDTTALIAVFNSHLYYKHGHRVLDKDKDHVFIRGYEDETATIVSALQEIALEGIAGYSQAVARWLM